MSTRTISVLCLDYHKEKSSSFFIETFHSSFVCYTHFGWQSKFPLLVGINLVNCWIILDECVGIHIIRTFSTEFEREEWAENEQIHYRYTISNAHSEKSLKPAKETLTEQQNETALFYALITRVTWQCHCTYTQRIVYYVQNFSLSFLGYGEPSVSVEYNRIFELFFFFVVSIIAYAMVLKASFECLLVEIWNVFTFPWKWIKKMKTINIWCKMFSFPDITHPFGNEWNKKPTYFMIHDENDEHLLSTLISKKRVNSPFCIWLLPFNYTTLERTEKYMIQQK